MSVENGYDFLNVKPIFKEEENGDISATLELALNLNSLIPKYMETHSSIDPTYYRYLYLKRVFASYVECGHSPIYNKETKLKLLFLDKTAWEMFYTWVGNEFRDKFCSVIYTDDFKVEENTVYISVVHLESLLQKNTKSYKEMSEKLKVLHMD